MKPFAQLLVLVCSFVCAQMALAQTVGPLIYPVIGSTESLPLRVLSRMTSGYRGNRQPATPCSSGGTVGNFTIVLNCDGNDSDGSTNYESVPDTDLAVSEQYVFQTVDNVFTIYNKIDLSVVEGPNALTLPWTGFESGLCSVTGIGDDFIVRYDKAAQRWVLAVPVFSGSNSRLCIAVSTSSDPTGTYYLYMVQENGPPPPGKGRNAPQIQAPPIWDYPKLGVWTDAYYVGFNMLTPKPSYLGPQACALDRTSMLAGTTAAPMQCFFRHASSDSFMLPADIAGGTPATGEPEFFLDIAQGTGGSHTALNLFSFHIDFTNYQNSTFTGPTALAVTSFAEGSGYVPEPHKLMLNSRSDRLMVPLAWRQTPDLIEHLVANDAISASGVTTEQWFDITNPATTPRIAQQDALAPDTGDNFWMGSLNMDNAGNIAFGISNAGVKIDPGILFTGRLATDPLGTMEPIETMTAGAGYQGSSAGGQWGDHSIMAVDPSDDCTFWYSTEYYTAANTDTSLWSTRIMEFKFNTCQ